MADTNPSAKLSTKSSKDAIIVRQARLFEGARIGQIAAKTYFSSALTDFLSPLRSQYYSDYERGFQQRAQARIFNPNNLTFVACEASNPDLVIGYAQFARFGDDAGYQAQMKRRDTYWLRFLACWWFYWTKLILFLTGGDRSASPEGLKLFLSYVEAEEKMHWSLPERKNKWEAQSVVVLEEFQGRGIGKMLMMKVIEMAEEEGVIVGLAASKHGRWMYTAVGFELLAEFQNLVHGDAGGGVMMYTPLKMRKAKDV